VFVRQQLSWPSLAASTAAHGLVLALIPTLLEALSGAGYLQIEQTTYMVEPLRLELPDRVYLPAARPHPNQSKEQSKAAKPAPARHSQQAQPAAGAGLRSRASLPKSQVALLKRLELPVTQHESDLAPVILQPDPVIPTLSVPVLPPIAFWTRASQLPPPRRAFIPGRVQKPSVTPKLDTPPILSPPNPQLASSDIAAALADAQTTPKLPLPNASTNPVRIRGNDGTDIASFDVAKSDPINLIYLMADNSTAKQVEIPRGLQNTPQLDADGGPGMTPVRASDDGQKSASSVVSAHDRTTAGADGAARVPEAASAAGTASVVQTPGAPGAGSAPGAASAAGVAGTSGAAGAASANGAASTASAPGVSGAAGASGATADNASARASQQDTAVVAVNAPPRGESAAAVNPADRPVAPPGAPVPDPVHNSSAAVIRTTHPSNGNFDVVILQSVTRDDLPDVGGMLSGNPVYTVYLSVGDAREWLLEYCIPASVNSPAGSYRVNIDDPGGVSAPYPLSTVIPRKVFELPHPRNTVLHGRLSTAGILRDVKAPNMENALVREVLPLLSQWQFRPALRDKVPVEVEVLLIIPPQT